MKTIHELQIDNGNDCVIVAKYSSINYVLIYRNTNFEPWIAAWNYDEESETWMQGHYFQSLRKAMAYIESKCTEVEADNEI